MVITALVAALGVVIVLVLAYVIGTRAAGASAAAADERMAVALEQQASALAQQAAQLEARLGMEREHTVTAAADMAAKMAGEKLGDSMTSGTRQLDLRTTAFEKRVEGLTSQLERLGDVVGALQKEGAQQHGQLLSGLKEATSSTRALAETTGHLREALASPKARGQWGERMADDVLRLAGMVEGVTYKKQTGIVGGAIPDVTFLLPGGRVLHMDVKFPVDNYLRHLEATSDAERDTHAKAFLRDVRGRVKELSTRTGYIDADATLDEVLLFIPNESVWAFIHERDPQLIDVALAQKVVLCSPVSLFAVLAVIRQAVEQTALTRTSNEILECLAGFGKEWTKFSESLDGVVRKFDTAQRGLEEVTGPRRRQLDRQLDRIEALRAHRDVPELPFVLGDGEGEVQRRASGDVRPWGVPEAG
ncbi:MAG: DNA recombination protein RmuC [Acidimicrobiales bacterium]